MFRSTENKQMLWDLLVETYNTDTFEDVFNVCFAQMDSEAETDLVTMNKDFINMVRIRMTQSPPETKIKISPEILAQTLEQTFEETLDKTLQDRSVTFDKNVILKDKLHSLRESIDEMIRML
jgi:hypothetical protein